MAASKGTKLLQAHIPEEKHIQIKIAAIQNGMNIKDYILRAVDYYEKNVLNK